MSSTRRAKNKKKLVAAVLLVLCTLMLCLLLVMKLQESKGTGGGGGGYATDEQSEKETQSKLDESGDTAEDTTEGTEDTDVEGNSNTSATVVRVPEDPDSPALKVLTWEAYNQRSVLYSKYRIVISGEDRTEIAREEVLADITSLKLKELGLEENQRYWYKILPINESNLSSSSQVKLHEGSFYLDLVQEPPASPVIKTPKDGGYVDVKRPVVEWDKAIDKDPHQSAKLTYKVELKGSGNSQIWSGETQDAEIEIGADLTENSKYTLQITAIDPDGLQSPVASLKFGVDATKDKPTRPAGLAAKRDAGKSRMYLTWKKSSDPNPSSSIKNYYVIVRDNETHAKFWTTTVKRNSTVFATGEYGKSYSYQVKGRSTSGTSSAVSKWSAPFLFTFNYTFVPTLIAPATDGQTVPARPGLSWTGGKDVKQYIVTIGEKQYETTEPKYSLVELQRNGTLTLGNSYKVEVHAINVHDFETKKSALTSFVLADSPPDKPGAPEVIYEDGSRAEIKKGDMLMWTPATDLEGPVTYVFEVSKEPDFSNPVLRHEIPADKGSQVSFRDFWKQWQALDKIAFRARIVAKDNQGNTTPGPESQLTKIEM